MELQRQLSILKYGILDADCERHRNLYCPDEAVLERSRSSIQILSFGAIVNGMQVLDNI